MATVHRPGPRTVASKIHHQESRVVEEMRNEGGDQLVPRLHGCQGERKGTLGDQGGDRESRHLKVLREVRLIRPCWMYHFEKKVKECQALVKNGKQHAPSTTESMV